MKHKKFYFTILICLLLLFFSFSNPIKNILNFSEDFYVSYGDIKANNDNKRFGDFVSLNLKQNDISTGNQKEKDGEIIFKLFGFIPIKKVHVKIMPEEKVFVGGIAVGLSVKPDGVVVLGNLISSGEDKYISKKLKNGDIIKEINNKKVSGLNDIEEILRQDNRNVELKILRNGKEINENITILKNEDEMYKLGVFAKDEISGVGTLTFVRKDNKFAALGHAVNISEDESVMPIIDGNLYSCSLVGINKGKINKPGELRCVFSCKDSKGDIVKNTKFGIYGKLDNGEDLIDGNLSLSLGGRLAVRPGKAKIISSVSGLREEYEIEIIKASYQTKCSDKSIVFRVKDKRLLELTGGIIQGMSGSPIVQDNKIVGAVTHVFLSDPTKGYGVYCDWMIDQMEF